ncbi:hypothetical protein RAS1_12640 [Phycisphaerae bacterium RAS1]|nr:hypothetical protein RAS1_12640 [Phycisphaerae bacterium RAS1]
MKTWWKRGRKWTLYVGLGLGATMPQTSCGLNDRELSQIYQSVLTTGLTTLVTAFAQNFAATVAGNNANTN